MDVEVIEQPSVGIAKADSVRLYPRVQAHVLAEGGLGSAHESSGKLASGEQRFPAVQDERHAKHLENVNMLADAHRSTGSDLHRHLA